jgi:hypothetical protein
MLGDHFYHAILRKSVAVFGTLFNDINVVRRDNNNIVKDVQRVPLSYGPKQKFLSRIDQQPDLDDTKVALKLPRMSFEITALAYDSSTNVNRLNKMSTSVTQDTRNSVGQATPYILDMQLNIMAKNQDDALQILEQIVPYFQPTYTVAVQFIEGINKSFDVPISLQSITMADDYEGEYTQRRALIYSIDFSMKIKFFGRETESSIIRTVIANNINMNNNKGIESLYTKVNPEGATSASTMDEPLVVRSFIPSDTEIAIKFTSATDPNFVKGETIVGSTTGVEAEVNDYSYDQNAGTGVLYADYATGYLLPAENITGDTSNTTVAITDYTVG